jgi:conjugal transfer ATP-binding protein TraC
MLARLGKKITNFFGEEKGALHDSSHFNKALGDMAKFYKICDLLPYDSFDEKTQIFYNTNSLGFVIETTPLVGCSQNMQKEISNIFNLILPEESSLQVVLWADPHIDDLLDDFVKVRSQAPSVLQTLMQKRKTFLNSFAYKDGFQRLRNFRVFLSFSLPSTDSPRDDVNHALSVKSQIITTLSMLNMQSRVWGPNDLLGTLDGILNLNPNTTKSSQYSWNRLQNLSTQLTFGDLNLKLQDNELTLGNQEIAIRSYSVKEFPSTWSLHAMGEVIGDLYRDQGQIPCPFMLHYGVYIPKQDNLKGKILAKSAYVEKQAYSPIGKYLPDIGREAQELAFVKTQLDKGDRIVQTNFCINLLSPKADIEISQQTLTNLLTSIGWKIQPNKFLQLPMFLNTLPMMWGEEQVQAFLNVKKIKTTLSMESSNLLPLQGEWQGTTTPGLLLTGRRGQILRFSSFDNDAGNYNMIVVGRSGAGKSVFMQEIMTSTLGLGGRVFVLDVGRSFEKTCSLLGGQFIEFEAQKPICLNPFSTIPIDDDEYAQDAMSMLKKVLGLMASPSNCLDDKGAALLEKAMFETWKVYKNNTNISLIANWLLNNDDQKAKDLGQMLYPYTKNGVYGRFFESFSNVDLTSPLVVIEFEELKERKDLQAVIVQMVVVNITNQMFLGNRQTPFHIIFDEAWDLLREGGEFIETLARRLRKYKGSLVVGTQSINDFYVNPGAQAAFDNSDWMCLLSQKPESIELLKKSSRLSLSAPQEELLKSVRTKQGEYAEVMISGPNGYAVGRLILDPFAKLLYSTKAQDYGALKSLQAQGMDVAQAINYLIANGNGG